MPDPREVIGLPGIAAFRLDPATPEEAEQDKVAATRILAEMEAEREIVVINRTPDDLPNGPVCDIDRVQPVAWTYPCDSFMLPELRWESITDWAMCEGCAVYVEAEEIDGLWARFLESGAVPEEDRGDERVMRALELIQKATYQAFFLHRWGERRPFNPDEDHAMPEAIRVLPRDERGLPIPFAQLRVDGRPDFRSLDQERVARCVNDRLCGLCGRPLDYWIAFIGGPACRANRLFKDPAMHPQCAEYAARACPFIAGSATKYSARPLPQRPDLAVHVDRNMADHERRPAEMFLFTTRRYKVVQKYGETYIEATPWAKVKTVVPVR